MFQHFKDWCLRKLQRSIGSWRPVRPLDSRLPPALSPDEKAASSNKEAALSNASGSPGKQQEPYVPRAGQRGKHVEWVPCSPVVADKMLELAKVGPEDVLIDPGSGDGRIAIRAARLGARTFGIESNPKLVELSRQEAEKQGVSDRATFSAGDFFECDFSPATVITLFLRWDLNIALREKILALKPGTRVVSNIFDMGDWGADQTVKVEDENYYFRNHTVHFWVVPARVEGTWKLPEGELKLSQKYQIVEGALSSRGELLPIAGRIAGERIGMTIDGAEFLGHVSENRMDVAACDGSELRWRAYRAP